MSLYPKHKQSPSVSSKVSTSIRAISRVGNEVPETSEDTHTTTLQSTPTFVGVRRGGGGSSSVPATPDI